ncbi:MAG: hypothetical protein E7231_11140 [Cellulosilyticum sp.]|nr:hypothetical protein [Cellulosilyticum sp.]
MRLTSRRLTKAIIIERIQVLIFKPEDSSVKVLTEIPFSKVGDMVNVRLITSPFALVKHDIHGDAVDFLWPQEKHIQFEENESLSFQYDGKLYHKKECYVGDS